MSKRIEIDNATIQELEKIKEYFDLRTINKTIRFMASDYFRLQMFHATAKNAQK